VKGPEKNGFSLGRYEGPPSRVECPRQAGAFHGVDETSLEEKTKTV